jgi:hypothetical protein
MDEEEKYFPPIVYQHFTQKQEEAILEASGAMASLVCLATPDRWRALRLQKMGSASHAHVELPFVLMSMDVWATPSVKDEFMAKLSVAAK